MRPVIAAFTCVLALAAPLVLSSCGGDDRAYDNVPASSPELVPPDDANDLAGSTPTTTGTTTTPAASGTSTTQATPPAASGPAAPSTGTGGTAPQPAPGTGTGGTGGGTGTGTGGGAAPSTGGVSPDDSANAGSVKQFCADNPGAC